MGVRPSQMLVRASLEEAGKRSGGGETDAAKNGGGEN